MRKLTLMLMLFFVTGLVAFSTWQLFKGNLEAAFSTFPFIIIIYLLISRRSS
jgi:hypothetical protein